MAKWYKNIESIYKLGLLAIFLFLLWEARSYPQRTRFFPDILAAVAAILIVFSFIENFIKSKTGQKEKETAGPESPPEDIREAKLRQLRELEEKSDDAGLVLLEESERKKRLRKRIRKPFSRRWKAGVGAACSPARGLSSLRKHSRSTTMPSTRTWLKRLSTTHCWVPWIWRARTSTTKTHWIPAVRATLGMAVRAAWATFPVPC